MFQIKESLLILSETPNIKSSPESFGKIDGFITSFHQCVGTPNDFDYTMIFDHLSELLLQNELTSIVAGLFRPLLIELVVRSTKLNGASNFDLEAVCDMFAKLLPSNPQLKRVFLEFTQKNPSPLDLNFCQNSLVRDLTNVKKKNSLINILKNILCLLTCDSSLFQHWNMGPLFILMREEEEQIAPLAFRCFQLYSGLSEKKARLLVIDKVYVASQLVV
ncbi:AAA ATPase midasin [Entomophthora muscae]|uniref:AAA ATPase midasin n=1 Tax=Entomophthora muscae TaxID=34485 RepID=A0ACC2UNX4_9FUNG|nr:AAA ATPase midasin [Entomophthora muscae]